MQLTYAPEEPQLIIRGKPEDPQIEPLSVVDWQHTKQYKKLKICFPSKFMFEVKVYKIISSNEPGCFWQVVPVAKIVALTFKTEFVGGYRNFWKIHHLQGHFIGTRSFVSDHYG